MFENTLEVGGAELKGGMLGEKSSIYTFKRMINIKYLR
jgi:hypothetical protein